MKPPAPAHVISIRHECGIYMPHGGHRARCSCGWASDCYAMLGDTQRAIGVHLRRTRREEFDGLSAQSSHRTDLARELRRRVCTSMDAGKPWTHARRSRVVVSEDKPR